MKSTHELFMENRENICKAWSDSLAKWSKGDNAPTGIWPHSTRKEPKRASQADIGVLLDRLELKKLVYKIFIALALVWTITAFYELHQNLDSIVELDVEFISVVLAPIIFAMIIIAPAAIVDVVYTKLENKFWKDLAKIHPEDLSEFILSELDVEERLCKNKRETIHNQIELAGFDAEQIQHNAQYRYSQDR